MTKKDLFRLIIKIFGLYSIIASLFSVLPSSISWILMDSVLLGIVLVIGSILVVIALFGFLIFKTDKVIGWLKLDSGFDDDNIEFKNFNIENILKLAVVVMGGLLLLNNIPAFLGRTLYIFKETMRIDFNINQFFSISGDSHSFWWLINAINILIGYLMLTNYTYISRILKKGDDKNEGNVA